MLEEAPATSAERKEFKQSVEGMARDVFAEENFGEAARADDCYGQTVSRPRRRG